MFDNRQLNLLRLRAELLRRGVSAELLELPAPGASAEESSLVLEATTELAGCDWAPLRESLEGGEVAAVVRLPGFGGLLDWRTQPGLTFAHELAERARVIACLPSRPFLTHSDAGHPALDPGRCPRAARPCDTRRPSVLRAEERPARCPTG